MVERRNATRIRDLPSLIEHPKRPTVGRSAAAPAARLLTRVAVGLGLVFVVALSVDLAVSLGNGQPIAAQATTIVRSHLGPGYPAHHGLAGPSRVGASGGLWVGYPPHFGLAGPSRVGSPAAPIGIGEGYPPHNGLAGPSHLGDGS